MNKNEFLHALGSKLKEELTASQIEEHLKYYNDYIKNEEGAGHSEQDIINSLGDPTLLARTILETSNSGGYSNEYQEEDSYRESDDIYQDDSTNQRSVPPIQFTATSGWGCLAVSIIAILVVGLILWLFGIVFKALTPIIVPVLLVLFIVAILKQKR